jgi:hypothetical protein
MEKIKQLFNELEDSVLSKKFIAIYENIRQKYPAVKTYPTAAELIRYLHDQKSTNYELKDAILSSLILEYQTEKDELIGSYFLIIFKPAIMKIFFQLKRALKLYPSITTLDIWLEIVRLFFEVITSFNIKGNNSRVALKIIDRLKKRVSTYLKNSLKEYTAECDLESEMESLPFESSHANQEEVITLLKQLTDSEVITEVDKHILLATTIYGKSMRELSKESNGLSYGAIRQKKVRARKAILSYLKNEKF